MNKIKQKLKMLSEAINVIKARNYESLCNKIARMYGITEDEMETVLYMVHSDDNVGNDDELKQIVEKMQKKGVIPPKVLYRGCSKYEYETIVKTGRSPVYTLSFSESLKIAKRFGPYVVAIKPEIKMCCYHQFLRDFYGNMKTIDPDEFESVDGNEMLDTADEELEWFCTNNYNFIKDGKVFRLIEGNAAKLNKIESHFWLDDWLTIGPVDMTLDFEQWFKKKFRLPPNCDFYFKRNKCYDASTNQPIPGIVLTKYSGGGKGSSMLVRDVTLVLLDYFGIKL